MCWCSARKWDGAKSCGWQTNNCKTTNKAEMRSSRAKYSLFNPREVRNAAMGAEGCTSIDGVNTPNASLGWAILARRTEIARAGRVGLLKHLVANVIPVTFYLAYVSSRTHAFDPRILRILRPFSRPLEDRGHPFGPLASGFRAPTQHKRTKTKAILLWKTKRLRPAGWKNHEAIAHTNTFVHKREEIER